MKKRRWLLMICICTVITLLCGLFSCNIKVYAADEDSEVLGYVVPKGLFEDGKMYVAICSVYGNATQGTEFYNNGKVYSNMFKVAGIKKLDLSGSWQISSTADLRYLDLSEIEVLDLSFNNLSGEIDLTAFTSLKRVNLSNNKITGVKITGLTQLEEIVLNNNEISTINLQDFKGNKVDLSNNKLTSIANITLPTKTGVEIDLVNNSITDVTTTVVSGSVLNLGVQTDKNDSSKIVLYKLQNGDIKVIIKGENFEKSSLDLTGECETIILAPGSYTIEYRYVADDSKVYVAGEIYTIDTVWKSGYKDRTVNTKPEAPTYVITVKGKTQTSTTIHNEGELKINMVDSGEVFISYNGTDWQKYDGGTIKLDKKNQTIYVKTVQNNVDSDVVAIPIVYQKEAISGWLTIIFVLLFLAGFFGAYWLAKKYWIDKGPSIQE